MARLYVGRRDVGRETCAMALLPMWGRKRRAMARLYVGRRDVWGVVETRHGASVYFKRLSKNPTTRSRYLSGSRA